MNHDLVDLMGQQAQLAAEWQKLRDRIDYLQVAVGRGDPRFTRVEFANDDFDGDAFDRWWVGRGRRLPTLGECLGGVR